MPCSAAAPAKSATAPGCCTRWNSCATHFSTPPARDPLARAFDAAEQHFWQAAMGLYADEADSHWTLTDYRGQNANMHACEAMISAGRATGERRYIERAEQLAQGICQRQ